MERSQAELTTLQEFDASYRNVSSPVMQSIERSVCGCDYGGTSWTTRDEAERMAQLLHLAPGKRLLEIGAGAGWPSLYLAKQTGCSAVLTDLPSAGLRAATERALRDGIADRCIVMQADGASLPVEDGSFDAISHSDVLCCLADKIGVLRECRRAIAASGRMVFTVIYLPPNLAGAAYAQAVDAAPAFVKTDSSYEAMLVDAGWRIVSREDLTEEFARSMRRMVEARETHQAELTKLLGPAEAKDMLHRMRQKLPAIERLLLKRTMFVLEPDRR